VKTLVNVVSTAPARVSVIVAVLKRVLVIKIGSDRSTVETAPDGIAARVVEGPIVQELFPCEFELAQ